jgi:PhnB protein
MHVQAYLFFDGRCEEALDFYRTAIGARDVDIMRYKDNPEKQPGSMPPGGENKVMHSSFRVGDTTLMASDGHCKGEPRFEGFSAVIDADSVADAERLFGALGNGGHVDMPLGKTFFSPAFGMVHDRFGVSWMVIVEQK